MNARRFVLAGGYYGLCLCESVRDILLNTSDSRELEFDVILDAVSAEGAAPGATYSRWDPKNWTPLNSEKISHNLRTEPEPIARGLLSLNDQEFLNRVGSELFNYYGKTLCSQQNRLKEIKDSDLTVTIKRNGKVLGQVGSGSRRITTNYELSDYTIESKSNFYPEPDKLRGAVR